MPDAKVVAALPRILSQLHATYPGARYELNWETPLQLLVATILAAQCTDERVNQVTPTLFKKYPDAKAYADAPLADLEEDLKPTGFYRQKAKTVREVCRALVERFGGEVPRTMEEMVTLPGVARKTANVVLNHAFQLPTGIIVDTHVQRVAQRMGLSDQKRPEKIEADLMALVPQDEWVFFGPAMVLHGRYTCTFHQPDCEGCQFGPQCPKRDVGTKEDTTDPEEEAPEMAARKPAASKTQAAAPSLRDQLPPDWRAALSAELDKPYFKKLEKFVAQERDAGKVYPPAEDVFNAFKATPFDAVKVLLLGQDPYHGEGEAHGMCFSVRPGVKVPPSLVNIFKELQSDLGCPPPSHGHLGAWAERGVLLLNAILTVRQGAASSHKDQGWETFTDAVIQALNARERPVVFLLWGAYAQKKAELIDQTKHRVLPAAHPSPLSSKKFFGSRPFSAANRALEEIGQGPIDWALPAESGRAADAPPAAIPVAAPVVTPSAAAPAEATGLEALLPDDWRAALADDLHKPSFRGLDRFLAGERRDHVVCPAEEDVFAALRLTPLREVRVVILGQEPPCAEEVADGLAYSVREEAEAAAVQQTLFRSLRDSLGCRLPTTGSLEAWARQGVLLLNAILTVRAGRPGSHKDKGWEAFTDAVLRLLNASEEPIVFALWGRDAQKKRTLITAERHAVLMAEHPAITPEKFEDANVFQEINTALELRGRSGVYWQLRYV